MEIVARGVIYVLLSAVCLVSAAMVGGLCALVGSLIATLSLALVRTAVPLSWAMTPLFHIAGAVVGGVYGLVLIARLWWSMARESDDPGIQSFVKRADNLGRIARSPR